MTRNCTHRAGLSMVEVMISLAIAAMLLTAVAAAFTASSDVIDHNDQFFRACQAARVSMNQMLTQIRRASAVTVSSSSRIDLITSDLDDITYRYEDPNDRILLITNDVNTDPDYRLASSVTACRFDADTETTPGGQVYPVRVTISMTVQVGDNVIRLSGSAAPRKSQNYSL
jgi:prepilin-type N-terminal cleavage/methylation domain-containing protein